MSIIKSIQRGTALCTSFNDPTYIGISSVNVNKAEVELLGRLPGSTGTFYSNQGTLRLHDATNVAFTPTYNGVGIGNQFISWEVVEYN